MKYHILILLFYYYNKFRKFRKRKNVFISAFPKSGSTYVAKVIGDILGLRKYAPFSFSDSTESVLDEFKLKFMLSDDSFCRLHMKGTVGQISLLKKYGLHPIILYRNLFDCMVSLHDHLENQKGNFPIMTIPVFYPGLSKTQKYEYLIQIALPWYIDYYISWQEAKKTIHLKEFYYEDLLQNRDNFFEEVFAFLGYDIAAEDKKHYDNKEGVRFNVGIAGRGKMEIPVEIQGKVYSFIGSLPYDFNKML